MPWLQLVSYISRVTELLGPLGDFRPGPHHPPKYRHIFQDFYLNCLFRFTGEPLRDRGPLGVALTLTTVRYTTVLHKLQGLKPITADPQIQHSTIIILTEHYKQSKFFNLFFILSSGLTLLWLCRDNKELFKNQPVLRKSSSFTHQEDVMSGSFLCPLVTFEDRGFEYFFSIAFCFW